MVGLMDFVKWLILNDLSLLVFIIMFLFSLQYSTFIWWCTMTNFNHIWSIRWKIQLMVLCCWIVSLVIWFPHNFTALSSRNHRKEFMSMIHLNHNGFTIGLLNSFFLYRRLIMLADNEFILTTLLKFHLRYWLIINKLFIWVDINFGCIVFVFLKFTFFNGYIYLIFLWITLYLV